MAACLSRELYEVSRYWHFIQGLCPLWKLELTLKAHCSVIGDSSTRLTEL